eukprot:jgi/Botrbrau1/7066/Bobra.0165s0089.1
MWRHNVQLGHPERVQAEDESELTGDVPSKLDISTINFLEVSKDLLTATYNNQRKTHSDDTGSIRANFEVPKNRLLYYYEVLINDIGKDRTITIGFAERNFKLTRHLGEEPGSYGYRAAEGKKYFCVHGSSKSQEYGPNFTTGDVIGAGILLETQEMFFTKNGKNLGTAFTSVCKSTLLPTVSLHSYRESVTFNFGESPFVFDLKGLEHDIRSNMRQSIRRVDIPYTASHSLVRSYLLYYGYADTLKAYDETSGDLTLMQAGPSTRNEQHLHLRKKVRDELVGGNVPVARDVLKRHCPQALRYDPQIGIDVAFYLDCLQFIEIVRHMNEAKSSDEEIRQMNEALRFVETSLTPLHGRIIESKHEPAYVTMLKDVLALIAFPNPEKTDVKDLLSLAQRQLIADAVNAAILAHTCNDQVGCHPQAPLERMLQQLKAVFQQLRRENGDHGEPFLFSTHLNSPEPPRPSS